MMEAFTAVQSWLFEAAVQPLVLALDYAEFLEDAYDGTATFLWGVIGIAFLLLLIPLQRLRPAEPVGPSRAMWADVAYTLLQRLGIFGVLAFFVLTPLQDLIDGWMTDAGLPRGGIADMVDQPVLTFVIYLLLADFVGYWVHRAQHAWQWWWELHALHHSQRWMTVWTDDRNHFLDDAIRAVIMLVAAVVTGLPPEQLAGAVVVASLVESLSHANLKLDFGWLGERALVSPRFHRAHHAIHGGSGAQSCNYAAVFPIWDLMFGTADMDRRAYGRTGIPDDDFGDGLVRQQWMGLVRLGRHLFGRRRSELGRAQPEG